MSEQQENAVRFPETEVQLKGNNGNIFALMGRVQAALRRDGHGDFEAEFARDIMSCGSYPEALNRMQSWVTVY